jgi:hypothetical protein
MRQRFLPFFLLPRHWGWRTILRRHSSTDGEDGSSEHWLYPEGLGRRNCQ